MQGEALSVLPLLLAGTIGLGLFLLVEKRSDSPLLDVHLLSHNRFFTLSSLAALGNYAATFGVVFFMSLFLQYAKGLSAREAGFILLLQPLMQVVTSPISGRLADRIAISKLATTGMLISAVGLLLASITLSTATPLWLVGLELMLIGAGFGIFITPNSTAIMDSVPRRQFGRGFGDDRGHAYPGHGHQHDHDYRCLFPVYGGSSGHRRQSGPVYPQHADCPGAVFRFFLPRSYSFAEPWNP